jgi:glutathione S-transferase
MLAPIRRTRRAGGRRGSRRLRPTPIPTLIQDDGEVLVESAAILDALDEMAGSDMRLTPPTGAERRRVLKAAGIAVAAMEKAQWAVYELGFHPEEKIHQPWIDHNDAQAIDGLRYLDDLAQETGPDAWLAEQPRMSQADISAAIACTFCDTMRPNLGHRRESPQPGPLRRPLRGAGDLPGRPGAGVGGAR